MRARMGSVPLMSCCYLLISDLRLSISGLIGFMLLMLMMVDSGWAVPVGFFISLSKENKWRTGTSTSRRSCIGNGSFSLSWWDVYKHNATHTQTAPA